jgi:hypothetical protein
VKVELERENKKKINSMQSRDIYIVRDVRLSVQQTQISTTRAQDDNANPKILTQSHHHQASIEFAARQCDLPVHAWHL